MLTTSIIAHALLAATLAAPLQGTSVPPAARPPTAPPRVTPSVVPGRPGASGAPGLPGASVAPAKPAATGDAAFDEVRTRFSDLSRWLASKREMGPDQRREIERSQVELAKFVAEHPDNAAALGMLVQTNVWLGEVNAVQEGFQKLAALRPTDGAILTNWATFWRNRNDCERALAALDVAAIDVGVFPQAATLKAECLLNLGRFDQAELALNEIPPATASRPDIAFNLDRLKKLAGEYKGFWAVEESLRAAEAQADDLPRVELVTERGRMVLELFENSAPNTVANFIDLAKKEFYDGTKFHRVLPGFVAQGGDPNTKPGASGAVGSGGPGYRILGEATKPEGRKHFTGTVSMAHNGNPDNAGSQFFICFGPAGHLNGVHTAFGRVLEGQDVLMATQPQDVIKSVKVLRQRDHEYKPETLPELPPPPPMPPTSGQPPRLTPASR